MHIIKASPNLTYNEALEILEDHGGNGRVLIEAELDSGETIGIRSWRELDGWVETGRMRRMWRAR